MPSVKGHRVFALLQRDYAAPEQNGLIFPKRLYFSKKILKKTIANRIPVSLAQRRTALPGG